MGRRNFGWPLESEARRGCSGVYLIINPLHTSLQWREASPHYCLIIEASPQPQLSLEEIDNFKIDDDNDYIGVTFGKIIIIKKL